MGSAADRGVFWYFTDSHRKSLQMSSSNGFDNRFLECEEGPPAPQTIRKHRQQVLTSLHSITQGKWAIGLVSSTHCRSLSVVVLVVVTPQFSRTGVRRVCGRLESRNPPLILYFVSQNRFGHEHEDLDPTPKAPSEPFRFTPSLLDPNSSAFAAFANQPPPGLFTPTPGGGNTLYNSHSHHDLQTPNVGISIGTPLSLPNTSTAMPRPTAGDVHDYNSQTIQPHQFHNYQPFSQSLHSGYLDASHYHTRPPSGPGSPMDVGNGVDLMQDQGPLDGPQLDAGALMSLEGKQYDHELAPHSPSERFVLYFFFLYIIITTYHSAVYRSQTVSGLFPLNRQSY